MPLGQEIDEGREVCSGPLLRRPKGGADGKGDQRSGAGRAALGEPFAHRFEMCRRDIESKRVGIDGDSQRGTDEMEPIVHLVPRQQGRVARDGVGQKQASAVAAKADATRDAREERPERGVKTVG